MSSFCLVLGVCVLLSLCAVATSIDTPYLLFSTGATINRVEPDGSPDDELVTDLSGAYAVDYHYTEDRMFWTNPTNNEVYAARLSDGHYLTSIAVNSPRGLTVDRDNNKVYFSYKSGSKHYIANKPLGLGSGSNIPGLQTANEFSAILVNGDYLYYAVEHEIFKKKLSGGPPEEIYEAPSSDVRIYSMAFRGQHLYWAQDDNGIHSVIPSDSDPQQTHEIRQAFQARNGIGIIGNTLYWTAIDKVFKRPRGGSRSTVIDMNTTDPQLGGLVVVKP